MLPPELANPFERPPLVPLNPDTAGFVEDMLGKEARKAFVALDDEPPKPRAKPTEPTEEEKAAMRKAEKGLLERSRERFPTWKTIPLGEYKTVEELTTTLEKGGFTLGAGSHEILKKTPLSGSPSSVELVNVSVEDLGFGERAIIGIEEICIEEIYDRARELCLSLCPAEVGPALRLHYQDQPMDEKLNVAMELIADLDDEFLSFSVEHVGRFRLLNTRSSLGRFMDINERWVFLRSKQK